MNSKRGRLRLINCGGGKFTTVNDDVFGDKIPCQLRTVFCNGKLGKTLTLEEVRNNVK